MANESTENFKPQNLNAIFKLVLFFQILTNVKSLIKFVKTDIAKTHPEASNVFAQPAIHLTIRRGTA